jgi:hypothetical protein
MKISTRKILKIVGLLVAVLVTPIALFFGLWFASSAGSDRGSPKLAFEWSTLLSGFDDPDTATAENSRVWVIHCDNDEWMFGLAQGSHGIWRRGGGTVVTKDSDGEIRSFRGHVCWSSGTPFRGCDTTDLATVYNEIDSLGFSTLATESTTENDGLQQAESLKP